MNNYIQTILDRDFYIYIYNKIVDWFHSKFNILNNLNNLVYTGKNIDE